MADSYSPISTSSPSTKDYLPIKAVGASKPISSIFTTKRSLAFAYGFTFVFMFCTFFMVLNPSSPGYYFHSLNNFIRTTTNATSSYRSHFSSLFSLFISNTSSVSHQPNAHFYQVSNESSFIGNNNNEVGVLSMSKDSNHTFPNNSTFPFHRKKEFSGTLKGFDKSNNKNQLASDAANENVYNGSRKGYHCKGQHVLKRGNGEEKGAMVKEKVTSYEAFASKGRDRNRKDEKWVEKMMHCNIFDGGWVRDNSYPLFAPGSCPFIDEPFNCFLNGRPDNGYEKYKWQPKHCSIPRLNGRKMLKMLRGKRLVFVGDSLNRNMWESMVCILQNSVEDKARVFEASGKEEFRTEGSYSFVFEDYNCSVEFFRSPFLVQEWEMPEKDGSKKETLRIDMVQRLSDKYKSADVLIFNTGHWWTHEKTSSGEGYYQVGNHIYSKLDVNKAFRKAMTTWGRWVEANVDPFKTLVVFRGYSVSHFRGGEWNSGGQCDNETEPLKTENSFELDPPMVKILESVLNQMKTPVFYLNVTRMTNFRKDAHPSIYREQSLTEEERRSPLRFQDCSHWCLPGVPDTWNEIVYSQVLLKHKQKQQKKRHQVQKKRL